jgi:hypothetical protein
MCCFNGKAVPSYTKEPAYCLVPYTGTPLPPVKQTNSVAFSPQANREYHLSAKFSANVWG